MQPVTEPDATGVDLRHESLEAVAEDARRAYVAPSVESSQERLIAMLVSCLATESDPPL